MLKYLSNVKIFAHLCIMGKQVIIKEMVSIKDIEPERLGVNPFISSLVIPVNKIPIHGQYKPLKELAADGKPIVVPVEIEVESETHCKVYNDADRRKLMVVLSKPGKELFLWLIYDIKAARDYIWINKLRYLKENDIKSMNTYRAAVNDLMSKGFIAKTIASDFYWINPTLFFCGSRKSKFPQNVVRK